jgi:hypothetical protein
MQVRKQSEIWHRNVVTLIGYCQDGGLQMLVFEYLPNGSVCGHLYGNVHHFILVKFQSQLKESNVLYQFTR